MPGNGGGLVCCPVFALANDVSFSFSSFDQLSWVCLKSSGRCAESVWNLREGALSLFEIFGKVRWVSSKSSGRCAESLRNLRKGTLSLFEIFGKVSWVCLKSSGRCAESVWNLREGALSLFEIFGKVSWVCLKSSGRLPKMLPAKTDWAASYDFCGQRRGKTNLGTVADNEGCFLWIIGGFEWILGELRQKFTMFWGNFLKWKVLAYNEWYFLWIINSELLTTTSSIRVLLWDRNNIFNY